MVKVLRLEGIPPREVEKLRFAVMKVGLDLWRVNDPNTITWNNWSYTSGRVGDHEDYVSVSYTILEDGEGEWNGMVVLGVADGVEEEWFVDDEDMERIAEEVVPCITSTRRGLKTRWMRC